LVEKGNPTIVEAQSVFCKKLKTCLRGNSQHCIANFAIEPQNRQLWDDKGKINLKYLIISALQLNVLKILIFKNATKPLSHQGSQRFKRGSNLIFTF